jgi:isopentenyldiphosphate isomerase
MKPILNIRPEEKLAIVNENDEVIGEATLDEVHGKGLLHREAYTHIISQDKTVLLQRRADNHKWDLSSAGHVSLGESYKNGAAREFREELGLKLPLSKFNVVGKERLNNPNSFGINNRFAQNFLVEQKIPLEKFHPDPGEVEELRYFSFGELTELFTNPDLITTNLRYLLEKYVIPLIKQNKKIN